MFYLGTPYTLYPLGREEAFRMACRVAARLLRAGIDVVSPIAHSHSIAVHGDIDPKDGEFWLRADWPLMEAAKGLIVYQAQGWRESVGLRKEIEYFERAGKPIVYLPAFKRDAG